MCRLAGGVQLVRDRDERRHLLGSRPAALQHLEQERDADPFPFIRDEQTHLPQPISRSPKRLTRASRVYICGPLRQAVPTAEMGAARAMYTR